MNILFLCTGNSCRSQMAEGWVRHLKKDITPYSAGVETHGMNPLAVTVMSEVGIDISKQHSKNIDALPDVFFEYVITLCDDASERCPLFNEAGIIVHKSFPDPPRLASCLDNQTAVLEVYRTVRDQIRDFVEQLPGNLPL